MSMVISTCDCRRLIDSDFDPACFVGDDDIICEHCRDDDRPNKRTFATFADFMAHQGDAAADQEWIDARESA